MHKTLNQAKGKEYEKYVAEKMKSEYDKVWLWNDVPESVLIKNKIIIDYNIYSDNRRDIGIDIVTEKDGLYTYIQCKNHDNNVCVNDLAGFFFFMIIHDVSGTICYSNDVSNFIKNQIKEKTQLMRLKITLKHIPFDNGIARCPIKTDYVLREYQKEAVRVLSEKRRGTSTLIMPCGTGKTMVVSMVASKYLNAIILSPLRKLTHDIWTI